MKKTICLLVLAMIAFIYVPNSCFAAENKYREWSTFELQLGGFYSTVDTVFSFGSGSVGLEIDAEEVLDLDEKTTAFRIDGVWRFSENKRHRLDFSWFSINRDATRTLLKDLDHDGEQIIAGTTVNSFLDLDIYQVIYGYSFLQDERIEMTSTIGLYVMPISYGVTVVGSLVNESSGRDFTAPLPVIGLKTAINLTPDWSLHAGLNVMYLEIDSFEGSIYQSNLALEYAPWEHWALGLGYDTFRLSLKANEDDYFNVDTNGKVKFEYTGIQLYAKYRF